MEMMSLVILLGLAKGQLKCVKYIGRDPETFEEDAGQRREGLKLLSTQGVVPPLIHPHTPSIFTHIVTTVSYNVSTVHSEY